MANIDEPADVLEHIERQGEAKLKALRAALLAGEQGGIADGDVIGEVRERIRRRALASARLAETWSMDEHE